MRLILLGAPGTGKGSYAEVLKNHYRIPHISTGEIFREAIAKETPMGLLAKSYIDKGNLAPDDVTNEIVKERLQRDDCQKGFILDGYPRTINQAVRFTEILKELDIQIDAVLDLDIDYETVIERIINRRMCPNCGKGYNVKTLPPKKEGICDICNSSLITRDDDNLETIKSRLEVYEKLTKPLLKYYKDKNLLKYIDSSKSISEVAQSIIKVLEEK